MQEYIFSYGTLQKEQTQLTLFGRTLVGSADILKGYKSVVIEITDEAFLSTGEQKQQLIAVVSDDKDDFIPGTALEITSEELIQADKYEPDGYSRVKVMLGSGKEAWIYVQLDANT